MPLILLDLDGTLVDSRALIVRNMQAALEGLGLPTPPDEAIAVHIGLSLQELVIGLFDTDDPDFTGRIVEAYRSEALRKRADGEDHESLFPGIRQAVNDMRAAGHLLGIATGKARRGVDHFCQRFDMQGWFDTIQTPDTNPSKPHPGMIESALSETGAHGHQTIMVGDTTFDMEMAQSAGVHAVGVAWGNHTVSALEHAGAQHIVESTGALTGVIKKILREGTDL